MTRERRRTDRVVDGLEQVADGSDDRKRRRRSAHRQHASSDAAPELFDEGL
ncbi:hypothetical protein [Halostagnicola sp. A56]|uniref:hypothetical protein n=1 Tax=Halostagnicola sp. A56 TaxID=1495067 RepID=UPI0012E0C959|nr:hypothetical protein [Halostagnicola sp. A56]